MNQSEFVGTESRLLNIFNLLREMVQNMFADQATRLAELNQCRKHFPQNQSLLMNQATFDTHRHAVSPRKETSVITLPYLADEERELFRLLKRNNWRIEQERLGVAWVSSVLNSIIS